MKSTCQMMVFVLTLTAIPTAGQDLGLLRIVPAAAFNLPGHGGNVWSSELYAVNFGPEPADVAVVDFLPGSLEPLGDVGSCGQARWTLQPDQILTLPAGLGQCARSFVGAVIIEAGPGVEVRSRIVNHHSTIDPRYPPERPLRGLGQEMPIYLVPEEPWASADQTLWPMTWHRNRCGQPRAFDSYVGVVNHGDVPGVVRVGEVGDNAVVLVEGAEVAFGAGIEVPPHSWAQYRLHPHDSPFSDCRDAETAAIRVRTDGPVLVYGSVVDRNSQDPRTIPATPRPAGATNP